MISSIYHQFNSRLRQRGAAMIEGVIVVSALVVFFAGVGIFHRLYAHKIVVLHEARQKAWEAAFNHCRPSIEAKAIADAVGSGVAPEKKALAMTRLLGSAIARRKGQASVKVVGPSLLGRTTHTLKASVDLVCDEQPQHDSGDLLSLFNFQFSNLPKLSF